MLLSKRFCETGLVVLVASSAWRTKLVDYLWTLAVWSSADCYSAATTVGLRIQPNPSLRREELVLLHLVQLLVASATLICRQLELLRAPSEGAAQLLMRTLPASLTMLKSGVAQATEILQMPAVLFSKLGGYPSRYCLLHC